MQATYKPTDSLSFSVDGETYKDIFTKLAQLDEIFGEPGCGQCKSNDTYFKVRNSTAKTGKNKGKTFTYFEVVCRKCNCFLPIGQHNNGQGTLFPDRKIPSEDGSPVYDKQYRGWRKPQFRNDDDDDSTTS